MGVYGGDLSGRGSGKLFVSKSAVSQVARSNQLSCKFAGERGAYHLKRIALRTIKFVVSRTSSDLLSLCGARPQDSVQATPVQ